jgi:CRISPR system Cascade subunit CasB
MTEEATLRLFRALCLRTPDSLPRVAVLACVLSHVREEDNSRRFAQAIGRKSFAEPDSAVMKQLRFQRLAEAQGEEEILRGFRRAVDLVGGKVNVADLARLVWFFENEKTRRNFAFDYFGAGFAAPTDQPQ